MFALSILFEFWTASFERNKRNRQNLQFDSIYNIGRPDADNRANIFYQGRFQSQPLFHFERNENGDGLNSERQRAVLELLLLILDGLMHIGNVPGKRRIILPRTGSRVLFNMNCCLLQVPPTYFCASNIANDDSYFFIVS